MTYKALKYVLLFIFCLLIILIIARNLLFTGPIKPVSEHLPKNIIDMHVHIAGIGSGESGCYISDAIRHGRKFDWYLKAFDTTREEVEREGDSIVVDKLAKLINDAQHVDGAIVLALDGVIDDSGKLNYEKTEVYIPNDYVAKQTARYPQLYFGASINPHRKDALQQLEKVKAQGAKLIKWIPNIQMIDPSDKTLIPFYKKLIELNLPLLSHTGNERAFTHADDQLGDPRLLELPLSLGVTVIAAHIATTGSSESVENYLRILPMFKQYPNLYTELSSLTQINKVGYLSKALQDERLKGRILYGSDYPLSNTPIVSSYNFPTNLTVQQMNRISDIPNPIDRDVALKQALGVSAEIFSSSGEFFDIP